MKWILIFFLVILELLLLLLIIPAGVSLSAGDSYLNVYARALGLKVKIYPSDKRKASGSDGRKKREKKKASEKNHKETEGSGEKLRLDPKKIFEYLGFLADALSWIAKGIFVPKFVFDLHIHNDDAAKTAMMYGAACSAAGAAVPKIERFIKVRRREIRIYPEFEGKTSFMLDMTVMALPIQLIVVGIMLYCRWNRLNKDKAV